MKHIKNAIQDIKFPFGKKRDMSFKGIYRKHMDRVITPEMYERYEGLIEGYDDPVELFYDLGRYAFGTANDKAYGSGVPRYGSIINIGEETSVFGNILLQLSYLARVFEELEDNLKGNFVVVEYSYNNEDMEEPVDKFVLIKRKKQLLEYYDEFVMIALQTYLKNGDFLIKLMLLPNVALKYLGFEKEGYHEFFNRAESLRKEVLKYNPHLSIYSKEAIDRLAYGVIFQAIYDRVSYDYNSDYWLTMAKQDDISALRGESVHAQLEVFDFKYHDGEMIGLNDFFVIATLSVFQLFWKTVMDIENSGIADGGLELQFEFGSFDVNFDLEKERFGYLVEFGKNLHEALRSTYLDDGLRVLNGEEPQNQTITRVVE